MQNAPISKRYPKTIYYRTFAAKLLPQNSDKILYLDPDITINGDLKNYNLDLKDNFMNILNYIEQKKNVLTLLDQAIKGTYYGDKVITLGNKTSNLSDKTIKIHNFYNPNNKINYDWVKENTIIIHYYEKNKSWKENYIGILKPFYDQYKIN